MKKRSNQINSQNARHCPLKRNLYFWTDTFIVEEKRLSRYQQTDMEYSWTYEGL